MTVPTAPPDTTGSVAEPASTAPKPLSTQSPAPRAAVDALDGRVWRPWRDLLESKVERLRHELADEAAPEDLARAEELFTHATALARHRERWWRGLPRWWSGSLCDTAWRVVHDGEAHRLAALPLVARRTRVKEMLFDASTILDRNDPILQMTVDGDDAPTRDDTRELVRRYRQAWDDRYKRSATYRNRLIQLITLVTVVVALIVVLGAAGIYTITRTLALQYPTLDFAQLTGARFGVMVAIATFGSVGGLLAGSGQVVRMGGVYNPMHLPMLSLLVKVQMGALCGLAGVLAILGNLLPEVATRGWGTLAAFALVFGASQQLITQVVDRKVNALVTSEPRDQTPRT
jgi:hypothetical protein